ncbi:hypothetical protein WKW50_16190 [Ochrobactrum sp. GPK 3]
MSIEEAILSLKESVDRNNELLEFMTAAARAGLDKAKGEATKGASEEKPSRSTKGDTKAAAPKKTKAPTAKALADATKEFVEVDEDDEYEARKAVVKRILAKFDCERMSDIPEEHRQEALDKLELYKAGEDPFEGEEEEEKPRRRRDDLS